MLRKAQNELNLNVKIKGLSPLLIKDGREGLQAMVFQSRLSLDALNNAIRDRRFDHIRSHFFVPGSSIRGAWRSHLEKTLRSLDDMPKVCDPFVDAVEEGAGAERQAEEARAGASCSSRLANKEGPATHYAYRDSCPVCQIFGNTAQGSRIAFADGRITGGTPALVDNNAINRQTGAAISPFKSLVLVDAEVETEVHLRNFELWQAGLLAHLFNDLKSGFVRLGAGKSKGWGRVTAEVTAMKLTYFGLTDWFGKGTLAGIGEMIDKEAEDYGMTPNDTPPALPPHVLLPQTSPWRRTASINEPSAFWDACRPLFNEPTWKAVPPLTPRRQRVS